MTSCNKCGKQASCSCQFIQGMCVDCYYKDSVVPVVTNLSSTDNSGFSPILNNISITTEEKLRRINEILQKAINKFDNET